MAHNEILDHLRLLLPSIMIPSILIKIDEIPFTSNGKINHKNEIPGGPGKLEGGIFDVADRNQDVTQIG